MQLRCGVDRYESLQSPYKALVTLQKMRSYRTTLPYSFMDDSLERFITDLSTMCRRHPSVLREVVEGYVNNLGEDDFSRWEETLSQLWKNSESPNKKLEFSKSGIPLHMLDSIQIQELNEHEL